MWNVGLSSALWDAYKKALVKVVNFDVQTKTLSAIQKLTMEEDMEMKIVSDPMEEKIWVSYANGTLTIFNIDDNLLGEWVAHSNLMSIITCRARYIYWFYGISFYIRFHEDRSLLIVEVGVIETMRMYKVKTDSDEWDKPSTKLMVQSPMSWTVSQSLGLRTFFLVIKKMNRRAVFPPGFFYE